MVENEPERTNMTLKPRPLEDILQDEHEGYYVVADLARDIILAVTQKHGAFNPDFGPGSVQVATAYCKAIGQAYPEFLNRPRR